MRVSVIIPSFNCAEFVTEAVKSVQKQTIDDLEIFVVDDGSTDGTAAALASIDEPRMTVVCTGNRGISAARNEGLERARGEYIAFLDADDRWLPTKLERQVDLMEGEPDVCACFVNMVRFTEHGIIPGTQFDFYPEMADTPARETPDGHVIMGDSFIELIRWRVYPVCPPTLMFRASSVGNLRFVDAQAPDGSMVLSEDTLFFFQAIRLGGVAYITDPLAQIRRHGGNVTSRYHQPDEVPVRYVRVKLAALHQLASEKLKPRRRKALKDRMRSEYRSLGYQYKKRGAIGSAATAYARALVGV